MLCYATEAGLSLLRDLDAPIDAAEQAVIDGLSDRQRIQMLRALEQMRSDLAAKEDPRA
jgi:DNA-binding MarR family transcriptional regulator